MLNRVNATKNKIIDCVTAKERLKLLKKFKRPKKQEHLYTGIKAYIQRKELGAF
jgi:hypothetical protein